MTVHDLIARVEAAGYSASVPEHVHHGGGHVHEDVPADVLRRRLLVSIVLTVPVVALSMVPALQFDRWQWVAFALATPVVTWGAWPFHRITFRNLRHAAASMDTLVTVGILAAYGWSLWALFLGEAARRA